MEEETKKVALIKVINGMTYKVYVHFNENSKMTMKDKINKLIKNEMQTY